MFDEAERRILLIALEARIETLERIWERAKERTADGTDMRARRRLTAAEDLFHKIEEIDR